MHALLLPNTWRGQAQELLSKMDKQRCGGVPFFYNKDTKLSICGATTEANLRQWALGKPCEPVRRRAGLSISSKTTELVISLSIHENRDVQILYST